MHHLTLNTGHSRISPRREVGDDILAKLRPLLRPGCHDLGDIHPDFAGYRLIVPCPEDDTDDEHIPAAGFLASLYCDCVPLLTMAVAATADDDALLWEAIERLYLRVTDLPVMRSADYALPKRPTSLPWLAVVLTSPSFLPHWAGDFERCLAWTWIET